jgi:hypothetical protein
MKKIFLIFVIAIPFFYSCEDLLDEFKGTDEETNEETVLPFEEGVKPNIEIVGFDQNYFEVKWDAMDNVEHYDYDWQITDEFGEILSSSGASTEDLFLREENHEGCGRTFTFKVRGERATSDSSYNSEYAEVTFEIPSCEYKLVDLGMSTSDICETGNVYFEYTFHNVNYDRSYHDPIQPIVMDFDVVINNVDPDYVYDENLQFTGGKLFVLGIDENACDSNLNTGNIVVSIYAYDEETMNQIDGSPLVYDIVMN